MQLHNLAESPLVQAAREARRPTRWWLAYLVGVVGCIILAGIVSSGIAGQVVTASETSITAQVTEGFNFLVSALALFAWVRFKEGRPVSSVGLRGGQALKRFAVGLGIGAGLMTLAVLMLLALGQYRQLSPLPQSTLGISALVPVALLVVIWTIQSSTEEIITRGYFLMAPTDGASRWLSGGAFGPEASLVALVIWVVAVALAYRYFLSES